MCRYIEMNMIQYMCVFVLPPITRIPESQVQVTRRIRRSFPGQDTTPRSVTARRHGSLVHVGSKKTGVRPDNQFPAKTIIAFIAFIAW